MMGDSYMWSNSHLPEVPMPRPHLTAHLRSPLARDALAVSVTLVPSQSEAFNGVSHTDLNKNRLRIHEEQATAKSSLAPQNSTDKIDLANFSTGKG